jgi:hypothetical protein
VMVYAMSSILMFEELWKWIIAENYPEPL